MNAFDLRIAGGLVVTQDGALPLTVAVRDGRIAALFSPDEAVTADEEIDARDRIVMPGVIEPHCHFWDPGATHREDWATGTAAAAAGGVTTAIEMPLSDPPTVDADAYELKRARAHALSHVDFALWGGIVPESLPRLEETIDDLLERGAVAFKAFMCWSAREYPPVDDGTLLAAMRAVAQRGALLGLHAENDAVILAAEAAIRNAGRNSPQDYVDSRPEIAEVEAVERAVRFAEETGARIYIVHMSSGSAVDVVRRAKARGVPVFAETAPQYLTLDRTALDRLGPYAKCAPPLRDRESVDALWARIADGTIDTIGSDHAPFSFEEKEPGREDIWLAPNGIPGIQSLLPLVFAQAFHLHKVPLPRIAALLAGNAARLFGLDHQKGRIAVGHDADFAIVDPNREHAFSDDSLFYKNRWSPYRGMSVRTEVVRTIVRGITTFADGELIAAPGFGRHVLPARAAQLARASSSA